MNSRDQSVVDVDLAAMQVLIDHQRRDIGSCICGGWGVDTGDLGKSHSLHVWRELQAAGVVDRQVASNTGDDALHERLTEALNHSPTDALVTVQHVEELTAHLLPWIREHTAEVWEAYESWRETGSAAINALNVIWRALEPDRKHMVFGDDPQRVVDETLRALDEVASAVQSERERADRLVSWKDTGFRERDTWQARAETAEATIEQVRAILADPTAELVAGLAEDVHEAYLDACRGLGWPVKPENSVAYAELSDDSQELDLRTVRAVLNGLVSALDRKTDTDNDE